MRILTVVGNRPQFIKAAAVSRHLRERGEEILVHTGSALRPRALRALLRGARAAAARPHARRRRRQPREQTAKTLRELEPLLAEVAPDAVLVYGDTNATLGGALVAAKAEVPIAHVEAGMRSFIRTMPEEINRIVADRLSGLLLCSTPTAIENLEREGMGEARTARRRRDGRHRADLRRGRRAALDDPRAPRPRGAWLPAGHRAPRRERRRSRPGWSCWSGCSKTAAADAQAGAAAASPNRGQARRRRPAARGSRRRRRSPNRSAIST